MLFLRCRIDSHPLRLVRKLQMEMKQGGGINSPSDMQVSLISCETNTEFTQRSHISAVVFLASQDQHSQQFFFSPTCPKDRDPR